MDQEVSYSSLQKRLNSLKERKRFAEAEEEIRQALEEDPGNLFLKAHLADLYLRQRRFSEGRILAEEILSNDPQHPQALLVLGSIFLKQHSAQKALECFRQAFNRDPRPYLILKTAQALKEMGNLSEALEELDKILVLNPENLSFLKEKAFILNRMKQYDQALKTYETIKMLSPDDPFVQKEILRLRSRIRPEPHQILKEIQTITSMESKKEDAQVHGLLAQKLKEVGQVREAAAEYERAYHLDPQNLYFLKQKGFCLYHIKEYTEAISCLTPYFRKDPSDFYVRSTLKKCYEAQGDLKGFLQLLEEVSPFHPEQKSLLGMIRKIKKRLGIDGEKLNPPHP